MGRGVNEELLRAACKRIIDDPESWDQRRWGATSTCGTTFCLAGHALMASGRYIYQMWHHFDSLEDEKDWVVAGKFYLKEDGRRAGRPDHDAMDLLGLTRWQAMRLFCDGGAGGVGEYMCLVEKVTGIKIDG